MIFSKQRVILLFIIISIIVPTVGFSQIGNTNGQYDEVIKQAYTLLQCLHIGDKKTIKRSFIESNFQSKKEFIKTISSSNMKWASELLKQNGTPDKNDIAIASWKTVSKDLEPNFSINITYYFKGQNVKYSNSDDHFCFNFIKNTKGEYFFNGLLFFKKSDFQNVKKLSNNSK
jgi:hypothetical protein